MIRAQSYARLHRAICVRNLFYPRLLLNPVRITKQAITVHTTHNTGRDSSPVFAAGTVVAPVPSFFETSEVDFDETPCDALFRGVTVTRGFAEAVA